ncbi:MAG TPA: YciI family protein [Candidatus Binataceae bacterium]
MKFMLMIIDDEPAQAKFSETEMRALFDQVGAIEAELKASNKLVDSRALRPSAEAATVRMRAGRPVVTDGPFSESKEVLGGYFLVDCESRQEALEWARRFPYAGLAAIEVRPLWEMS